MSRPCIWEGEGAIVVWNLDGGDTVHAPIVATLAWPLTISAPVWYGRIESPKPNGRTTGGHWSYQNATARSDLRQPALAHVEVVAGHLDAGPAVALSISGYQRGAGAGEWIEDAPALPTDPHQLAHEVGRLAGEVVLVRLAYRLAEDTRQRWRRSAQRHPALATQYDVLGLVGESAALRSHAARLVPHRHTAPGEAGALQRVGSQRQLPPVGKQQHRRAIAQDAVALRQPQLHPRQVRALVAFVAGEVSMQVRPTALHVLLVGTALASRRVDAAACIWGISDEGVEAVGRQGRHRAQCIAVDQFVLHG